KRIIHLHICEQLTGKFLALAFAHPGDSHFLRGDSRKQLRKRVLPCSQIARIDLERAAACCDPLRSEIERHVAWTFGLDRCRQSISPFFKARRLPNRHDVLPPQSHIIVSAIGCSRQCRSMTTVSFAFRCLIPSASDFWNYCVAGNGNRHSAVRCRGSHSPACKHYEGSLKLKNSFSSLPHRPRVLIFVNSCRCSMRV